MKKKIISSNIGIFIKNIISDLVIGSVCLGAGGIACTHDAQGMVQSSSVCSTGSGQSSSLPAVEFVRDFLVNAFTGEISSHNERQIQFILDHSRKHFVQQDAQSAKNEFKKILTTFCFSDDFAGELIERLVKKDNITSYEVNNQGASGFPRITFKADIARTWPAAKLTRRTVDSRSNITFLDSLKYLVLKVDINANGVYASSMCTSYVKPCYIEVRKAPKEQLGQYCAMVKAYLRTLPSDKLLNYPWWSSEEFPPFYTIGRFVNTRMLFDSLIKAMNDKKGKIDTKRYINAKVKFDDNVSAWVSTYDVPIGDLNAEMLHLLSGAKTQTFRNGDSGEVSLSEQVFNSEDKYIARLVIRWTDSGTNKVVTGGTMYVIPPDILAQYKSTELVMPDDEEIYAPAEITTISSAESKLSAGSSAEMTKIETGSLTTKQEEATLKEGDLNKSNQAQQQLDINVLFYGQSEPEHVTYEKLRDVCSKDLPIEAIKIVKRSSECCDKDIAKLLSLLNGNGNIQGLKGLHIFGGVIIRITDLVSILAACQDSIEMVTLNVMMHLNDFVSVCTLLRRCESLARCVLPRNDQLFTEEKSVPLKDLLYLEGRRIYMSWYCLLRDKWCVCDSALQEQYLIRSLSFEKGMLEKLADAETVNISEAVDLQSYFRILLKNKKLKELKVSNNIMYAGDIYALTNLVSEVPLERLVLDCDMRAHRLTGLFAVLKNNCIESSLTECVLPREEHLLACDKKDGARKLTAEEVKNLNLSKYHILISCVKRQKRRLESEKKVRTRSVKNRKWYETELITSEDSKITGIKVMQPGETIEMALDDIAGISITGYCDLLPILSSLINKPNLKRLIIEQNFVTDEEQDVLSDVIKNGAIETIDVSKCSMEVNSEIWTTVCQPKYLRGYTAPEKIVVFGENTKLNDNVIVAPSDSVAKRVYELLGMANNVYALLLQQRKPDVNSGKAGSKQQKFRATVAIKTVDSRDWKLLTPLGKLDKFQTSHIRISPTTCMRENSVFLHDLFAQIGELKNLNTLEISRVEILPEEIEKLKVDSLKKITLNCPMSVKNFLSLAEKLKLSKTIESCDLGELKLPVNASEEQLQKCQRAKEAISAQCEANKLREAEEAIRAQCEANKSRKAAETKTPKKTKTKKHDKKKKK